MEPIKPMKPMKPMEPMRPMEQGAAWWPTEMGSPDSTGTQNRSRYAYFARARRLVVDVDGKVTTYDTGPHHITGFGQQQGDANAMTFQSDQGTVDLASLSVSD